MDMFASKTFIFVGWAILLFVTAFLFFYKNDIVPKKDATKKLIFGRFLFCTFVIFVEKRNNKIVWGSGCLYY